MITKNLGMHYYDWFFFDEDSMCQLVGIEPKEYSKWCQDIGQDRVRTIRNSGVPKKYEWDLPIPNIREDITERHPGEFSIPQLNLMRKAAEHWNNEKVLQWLDTVRIMSNGCYEFK